MSINDHSRFAPSALSITVACPGSVMLQASVPEPPETEELAEGTAAHHVASEYLRGRPMRVGVTFELKGRTWTVDNDMAEGAELWADTMGPGCTVEEAVQIPTIHKDCWGTPDGWKWDAATKILTVGDYKYGHRWVDPFENYQLAAYAAGILGKLGALDAIVRIYVVQPRAFHPGGPAQLWETSYAGLQPTLNRIRIAVETAAGDRHPTRTGPACKDCKARHVCHTLRTTAANIVDFSGHAEAVQLDTVAAATELVILDEALARLEARRTGIYAQVDAAARSGQHVPWWKLEPGQSRLKWLANVTVNEVKALGAMCGVVLTKPEDLVTPTQAVAALKRAGVDGAVIAEYSERPPGGVSLKRDTGTAARKIFGGKP